MGCSLVSLAPVVGSLSLTAHSTRRNTEPLALQGASGAFPAAGATLTGPLLLVTETIWRSD